MLPFTRPHRPSSPIHRKALLWCPLRMSDNMRGNCVCYCLQVSPETACLPMVLTALFLGDANHYGVRPIQINELISITNVLIPKTRIKYLQNFYNSGEFLRDWWKEDDWYFEVINVSLNLLKSKQVVIVIKKLCVDFLQILSNLWLSSSVTGLSYFWKISMTNVPKSIPNISSTETEFS